MTDRNGAVQDRALPPVSADDDIDVAFLGPAESYHSGEWVSRIACSYVDGHARSEWQPEVFIQHAAFDNEQILIEGGAADAVHCQGDRSNEGVGDLPGKERRAAISLTPWAAR